MKSVNLNTAIPFAFVVLMGFIMVNMRSKVLQEPSSYIYFARSEQPLPPRDQSAAPIEIRNDFTNTSSSHGILKYTQIIPEQRGLIPFALAYLHASVIGVIGVISRFIFIEPLLYQYPLLDSENINLDFIDSKYQSSATRSKDAIKHIAYHLNANDVLVTNSRLTKYGFYNVLRITAKIK
jgi:hypothetical protein